MKYSIKLEVDLSDEEIEFLKRNFLNNRVRKYNIYAEQIKSVSSLYGFIKNLEDKSIIIVDNIGNSSLTQIGNKILDLFDRDIKINNLLNE